MRQTVIITGTSSGLGKTAAKHFAANGWNVVATMRTPSAETELVTGENLLVTRLDVRDPDSIERAISSAVARFGRIDVLVNNAGFGLYGPFEATPKEKVREQFDVNLFGVLDVTRAVLPHFRANRGGTIVNVSSGAGVFTLPLMSLYCASKFALEGFSESLSYELAAQGIAVKIVEPGGVVSTNFGRRSGVEAAGNAALPDYDPFAARVGEVFDRLRASRSATEEDVARVVFAAATDGTDQLRYVATEDIKPWVRARRETSEREYMATMRAQLVPALPGQT
jgi:NAD(P)-dependent dehydrogenase (short-subunit alcohol dehydrogenase family)